MFDSSISLPWKGRWKLQDFSRRILFISQPCVHLLKVKGHFKQRVAEIVCWVCWKTFCQTWFPYFSSNRVIKCVRWVLLWANQNNPQVIPHIEALHVSGWKSPNSPVLSLYFAQFGLKCQTSKLHQFWEWLYYPIVLCIYTSVYIYRYCTSGELT